MADVAEKSVGERDDDGKCVWPPVLLLNIGGASENVARGIQGLLFDRLFTPEYRFDGESFEHVRGEQDLKTFVYAFPPSGRSYVVAKSLTKLFGETLYLPGGSYVDFSYATVADMNEIDPDKKRVRGWAPLEIFKNAPNESEQSATVNGVRPTCNEGHYGNEIANQPSQIKAQLGALADLSRRIDEVEQSDLKQRKAAVSNHLFVFLAESSRVKAFTECLEEDNTRVMWLQQLGTHSGRLLANECEERVRSLHTSGVKGDLLSKVLRLAGGMEIETLELVLQERQLAKAEQEVLDKHQENFHSSLEEFRAKQHNALLQYLLKMREEREAILERMVCQRMKLVDRIEVTKKETLNLQSLFSIESAAGLIKKVENINRSEKEDLEKHHKTEKENMEKHHKTEAKLLRELQEARQGLHELEQTVNSYKRKEEDMEQHHKATEAAMLKQVSEAEQELHRSSECSICFQDVEGIKRTRKRQLGCSDVEPARKRACFSPCNHASVCTECALKIWTEEKLCPICKTKLTEQPTAIYL